MFLFLTRILLAVLFSVRSREERKKERIRSRSARTLFIPSRIILLFVSIQPAKRFVAVRRLSSRRSQSVSPSVISKITWYRDHSACFIYFLSIILSYSYFILIFTLLHSRFSTDNAKKNGAVKFSRLVLRTPNILLENYDSFRFRRIKHNSKCFAIDSMCKILLLSTTAGGFSSSYHIASYDNIAF